MSLKIVRNDITRMETEAIVNTANEKAVVGTGCDFAIHEAAGRDELLQYRREHVGKVKEGEVFLTPGFHLSAKYIIHAVSPLFQGGDHGEERKLRACYRNSLKLAKKMGIRSIAFPLIATGGFGYPKEEGLRIAVDEIHAFLLKHEMEIFLVVFGVKASELGEKLYPDLEEYIDQNYVEEKTQEEYSAPYFQSMKPMEARPKFQRRSWKKSLPNLWAGSQKKLEEAEETFEKSNHVFHEPTAYSERRSIAYPEPALMAEEEDAEFSQLMAAPKAMAPSAAPREDMDYEALDIEELERKLQDRMRHRTDSFSKYLLYLIQEKNMTNSEVWKRGIVDKKVFSKIKNNPDYHPQKLTALCLCVGARLNLDESKDLLARAGYALSPCDKTDIIFSYFIENQIYDMVELDIQLEEYGLPCIIS